MIRSGSDSSTWNGPISVRRSAVQWPPSASAIARTYVPEETCSSSRNDTVRIADERQLVDVHGADRHLDGDTASMEGVRALAVDLHRGHRGNRELDRAPEAVEPGLQLLRGGRLVLVDPLTFDVTGRRPCGEVDLGLVALRQPDEPRLQPRRGTRQEQQEPGREGIERTRVTRPRPRLPTRRRDDRERRRPGGLVDEDDSARMQRAGRH